MAAESFTDTFAHLYKPADLAAFLDEAFGPQGLPAQIGRPDTRIRVAIDGDAIAGFAKIAPCHLPSPPVPEGAAELHQLYVLKRLARAGYRACPDGLGDGHRPRRRGLAPRAERLCPKTTARSVSMRAMGWQRSAPMDFRWATRSTMTASGA